MYKELRMQELPPLEGMDINEFRCGAIPSLCKTLCSLPYLTTSNIHVCPAINTQGILY